MATLKQIVMPQFYASLAHKQLCLQLFKINYHVTYLFMYNFLYI